MAGSTTAYAHRHEADSGTDSSTWRTFRGARWDESRRDVWISSDPYAYEYQYGHAIGQHVG